MEDCSAENVHILIFVCFLFFFFGLCLAGGADRKQQEMRSGHDVQQKVPSRNQSRDVVVMWLVMHVTYLSVHMDICMSNNLLVSAGHSGSTMPLSHLNFNPQFHYSMCNFMFIFNHTSAVTFCIVLC